VAQTPDATPVDEFRTPFVGHLPGYLAHSERAGAGRPAEPTYIALLQQRWRTLLDDPASRDEKLVHAFLERHPSLLPGPWSVDGDSGFPAFPMAVISKPKLPGLSYREPDFLWLASDSTTLYPILIEIETPHKAWFYGDRAEIHSDLTHAQGQLAEWRAWFNRGHNRTAFLDQYELPERMARLTLQPRYVLIYGRRANYDGSRLRQEKRAELARDDERLMSFDRLTPAKHSALFACVRKRHDGYQTVAVPPSFTLVNDGDWYAKTTGWAEALAACADISEARRGYLTVQLELLCATPDAYVREVNGLRVRTPQWL
jgi:hypothetical protein